jgi:cysteine desulfuration protein SufE
MTSETPVAATIHQRIEALKSDFQKDPDWEARYKRVIEIGKALPPLSEKYRNEQFLVKGCQSQVWLHAEIGKDGLMKLVGDSDAVIVRGLVACLIRVYSESTPAEVLSVTPQFLKDLGFESHLSPSRANGLNSMVKQIYLYATAFKALAAAKY